MDVFDNLGIKIPNAVLVGGTTEELLEVEEVIEFLQHYGSIGRATVVDVVGSEFHKSWLVEYSSGAALVTLEPLLPHKYVTKDGKNTYLIRGLSSMYAEREGDRKTQAYLADLEQLAKASGINYAEVLKGMMSHIGASIAALDIAKAAEGEEEEDDDQAEGHADTLPNPAETKHHQHHHHHRQFAPHATKASQQRGAVT